MSAITTLTYGSDWRLSEETAALVRSQPRFGRSRASRNRRSQGGQSQGSGVGVSLFVPESNSNVWWPPELGVPAATGAQNDLL